MPRLICCFRRRKRPTQSWRPARSKNAAGAFHVATEKRSLLWKTKRGPNRYPGVKRRPVDVPISRRRATPKRGRALLLRAARIHPQGGRRRRRAGRSEREREAAGTLVGV